MSELSDADLAAIEARANAATPGPWFVASREGDDDDMWWIWSDCSDSGEPFTVALMAYDGGDDGRREHRGEIEGADAEFIAHARSDVPALLAALADARNLERDLTATLTDAGLPPSEHGGVRGAVLLLVGLWRGERQRAAEAEAHLRREKSLCAEANDAVQHYAQQASEAEADANEWRNTAYAAKGHYEQSDARIARAYAVCRDVESMQWVDVSQAYGEGARAAAGWVRIALDDLSFTEADQ